MAGSNNERSEREFQADVNQAVAETEGEIFSEALDDELPENDADTSLEEMGEGLEGEDLDEENEDADPDGHGEDDEEIDAKAEGDEPEEAEGEPQRGEDGRFQRSDEQRGHVPPERLREEANRRRAVETENEGLRQQMQALAQQFDALRTGLQTGLQQARPQQRQEAPKPPPKPDMFQDPEGHEAWLIARAEEKAQAVFRQGMEAYVQHQQQQFNSALDQNLAAHARGPRNFEFQAAYSALTSLDARDPQVRTTVQSIMYSPDPGQALFNWWDQNGGEDYRAGLRENLMEQLRQLQPQNERRSQSQQRQPRQEVRQEFRGPQRLPSLNGATGSNPNRTPNPDALDGSEGSVFEFATRRG